MTPSGSRRTPLACFGVITLVMVFSSAVHAAKKTLHLVQIAPATVDTYMLSLQADAMLRGLDLAIDDAKALYPSCRVAVDRQFKVGDDEALFQAIRTIGDLPGDHAVIGFSRTNSARVAAKAALGRGLVGISTAAFTDELQSINPNFITVSMPWTKQWELIRGKLSELRCDSTNTLGVFSFRDSLSQAFKGAYGRAGFTQAVERYDFPGDFAQRDLKAIRCVVLGTSLPAAIGPLTMLYERGWDGAAFGTGDWTYFTAEMKQYLARTPQRRLRLFSTAVWTRTENPRGAAWAQRYFGAQNIDPVLSHVHDAAMLAFAKLCLGADVLHFDAEAWGTYGLVRDYTGILRTGNLISPVHLQEIR